VAETDPTGRPKRRSNLGSTTQVGVEVGRVLRDRFAWRTAVPRTIGEVNAAYLSRVLDVRIDEVHPSDLTAGTTDRARLELVGRDPRMPKSVFVKIAPTRTVTRIFTNLTNLGTNEGGFYRDVRPELDIETPRTVTLDSDRRTKRFVIAIEDLTARQARFTDTVTGTTRAEAEAVVCTLARLHATFWGSPRLTRAGRGGLDWVQSNSRDPHLSLIQRALVAAGRKLAKTDPTLVPPAGEQILARYLAVADELDAGPHTVLHGDPHPGNVYFVDDPDGGSIRGGLFDWQVLRRGNGARDLTYFVVLALEPDQRREFGDALLDGYCEELARTGGPSLDPGELRLDVRKMVAYAYTSAVFTAAFAGLQAKAIAMRGLTKSLEALADLDTGSALASLR
jgi:hypothetical protein